MRKENAGGHGAGRGRGAPAKAGYAGKGLRSRLDLVLKQMFMIRAIVADFFLTCQAQEASLLDLATLRRYSTEHVGPGLELMLSDTVWLAEVRGEDGQLGYVLVEFQSRVDQTMPVRAMRYVNGVCRASLAESGGDAGRIGGVLPVVLYTGRARWTAPLHLKGEAAASLRRIIGLWHGTSWLTWRGRRAMIWTGRACLRWCSRSTARSWRKCRRCCGS